MEWTEKDIPFVREAMQRVTLLHMDIQETYGKLIALYAEHYRRFEDEAFLRLAYLHMQGYLEQGFPYEDSKALFQEILDWAGKGSLLEFLRGIRYQCERLPLNRSQIDAVLGRWNVSRRRSGNRPQVIEDIWDKIARRAQGVYCYYNEDRGEMHSCHLIINRSGCYMRDKDGRIYSFILDEKDRAYSLGKENATTARQAVCLHKE